MTDLAPERDDDSLSHVVDLPHPPEKIWRALTEPKLVARWLADNDLRVEPGARFTLKAPLDKEGDVACEVIEADPPRLLRYRWRADATERVAALDTIVSFTLSASPDGGARLTIVQEGFAANSAARAETPAAVACLSPLRRLPTARRAAASFSSRVARPRMLLAA